MKGIKLSLFSRDVKITIGVSLVVCLIVCLFVCLLAAPPPPRLFVCVCGGGVPFKVRLLDFLTEPSLFSRMWYSGGVLLALVQTCVSTAKIIKIQTDTNDHIT